MSPQNAPDGPQSPAVRPQRPLVRAGTTPWLFDDVRDVLAAQGDRKAPHRSRRRNLRFLFGA